MSGGLQYWIVATKTDEKTSKNKLKSELLTKMPTQRYTEDGNPPEPFFVYPEDDSHMRCGSFDDLVRAADEFGKMDATFEAMVRRVERQLLELKPGMKPDEDLVIESQSASYTFKQYMDDWHWDAMKFDMSRGLAENMKMSLTHLSSHDEDFRKAVGEHNELCTRQASLNPDTAGAKGKDKELGPLTTRSLLDTLTPEVMVVDGGAASDYVSTVHLMTLYVVVGKGFEEEFEKLYHTWAPDHVVPCSAKQLQGISDKDGNTIWRVVLFREGQEEFRHAVSQAGSGKFTVREFEYSEEAYKRQVEARLQTENKLTKVRENLERYARAFWSDIMVSWVHLKAARVFVECVLRYGLPPSFASFIFAPKRGAEEGVRKVLAGVFAANDAASTAQKKDDDEEGEEYFPYVFLSFTPFASAGGDQ